MRPSPRKPIVNIEASFEFVTVSVRSDFLVFLVDKLTNLIDVI